MGSDFSSNSCPTEESMSQKLSLLDSKSNLYAGSGSFDENGEKHGIWVYNYSFHDDTYTAYIQYENGELLEDNRCLSDNKVLILFGLEGYSCQYMIKSMIARSYVVIDSETTKLLFGDEFDHAWVIV